jgi:hypothetical protein
MSNTPSKNKMVKQETRLSMNTKEDALTEGAVDSQHQTIMQGGKIEEFADALGQFCRLEGWKKLKDENGEVFRSLRHYVEATPPFGAGYSGKAGMEKIEAYLSLSPRIKDYFQHCHANCLTELAQEQGLTPAVVSKKEWNDVMGARLARVIESAPQEAYEEKAAAYVEDKERVKPAPKSINEYSPIRMNYRPTYTYSFAQKLKQNVSSEDLAFLVEALSCEGLDELVEFEKYYNLALSAFNRAKSESGWGPSKLKAPQKYQDRIPKIKLSKWLEGEDDRSNRFCLADDAGEIVVAEMSKAGGVKGLSFY